MKRVTTAAAILLVAGCTTNAQRIQEIKEYAPVVDNQTEAMQAKYDTDLSACRTLAESVQEAYNAKADEERGDLIMGAIIGGLVGGVAGAAIGDSSYWTAQGATTGVVAGTAVAATEAEYLGVMQQRGGKGVVDECMSGRGHRILSVKGYGGG